MDTGNPVEKCGCPHCEARAKEEAAQEELHLALLLALVPLMVVTLFGQMGLF